MKPKALYSRGKLPNKIDKIEEVGPKRVFQGLGIKRKVRNLFPVIGQNASFSESDPDCPHDSLESFVKANNVAQAGQPLMRQ